MADEKKGGVAVGKRVRMTKMQQHIILAVLIASVITGASIVFSIYFLLRRIWHEGMPVRLVGVGVSGFGETVPVQLSLFDDAEKDQPAADGALSAAADQVRERFGADALQFGYDLQVTATWACGRGPGRTRPRRRWRR